MTEEPGTDTPGRNAATYIQNLLDVHDQYTMFLEKSFGNDKLFKNAIQSVRARLRRVCDCMNLCGFGIDSTLERDQSYNFLANVGL